MPRSNLAHLPQLLSPHAPEPVPLNKRSHRKEKPMPCNEEHPPTTATREKPAQQQSPSKAKNRTDVGLSW